MNPYTLNLIICIAGTASWIFVLVLFLILISKAKKAALKNGADAEKPTKSYVACIVLCGVACALPYLILFKPYVTGILEGCGVVGTLAIMKERLEKIMKQEEKK